VQCRNCGQAEAREEKHYTIEVVPEVIEIESEASLEELITEHQQLTEAEGSCPLCFHPRRREVQRTFKEMGTITVYTIIRPASADAQQITVHAPQWMDKPSQAENKEMGTD